MKTPWTILFVLLFAGNIQSQDYLITFSGTGGSSSVETVLVQNLTQGTTLTIAGSDTLRLLSSMGIFSRENQTIPMRLYPNPALRDATLTFQMAVPNQVDIALHSASGKPVCRYSGSLPQGQHTFSLQVLPAGIYVVWVNSGHLSASSSFVSLNDEATDPQIRLTGSDAGSFLNPLLKSGSGIIPMQYNAGDQLLFLGTTGIFATVFPFVPAASSEIAFFFAEATDGDGNHYPTVTIGSQIWMAQNLKTTRYTDGGLIEYPGGNNSAWQNNTSGAYAWFNNDVAHKDIYGALYNWYAVDTTILCPNGWHIPSNEEWNTLTTFLGGMDIAGGKLKETGLLHWVDPNLDATNETGFTALPGGNRNVDGSYGFMGSAGHWWSDTAGILGAYDRHLYNSNGSIYQEMYNKNMGFSVRCIKE